MATGGALGLHVTMLSLTACAIALGPWGTVQLPPECKTRTTGHEEMSSDEDEFKPRKVRGCVKRKETHRKTTKRSKLDRRTLCDVSMGDADTRKMTFIDTAKPIITSGASLTRLRDAMAGDPAPLLESGLTSHEDPAIPGSSGRRSEDKDAINSRKVRPRAEGDTVAQDPWGCGDPSMMPPRPVNPVLHVLQNNPSRSMPPEAVVHRGVEAGDSGDSSGFSGEDMYDPLSLSSEEREDGEGAGRVTLAGGGEVEMDDSGDEEDEDRMRVVVIDDDDDEDGGGDEAPPLLFVIYNIIYYTRRG